MNQHKGHHTGSHFPVLQESEEQDLDPPYSLKSLVHEAKPEHFSHIPLDIAGKFKVLPIGQTPYLATVLAPPNLTADTKFKLALLATKPIRFIPIETEILSQALHRLGSSRQLLERIGQSMNQSMSQSKAETQAQSAAGTNGTSGDGDATQQSRVVQLVDALISEASRRGASDVHIEAGAHATVAKFRIDGALQKASADLPVDQLPAIISRIKILAGLDISETRVPQDGRMMLEIPGQGRGQEHKQTQEIDVRVSVMPSINGESVVLRLLKGSQDTEFGDEAETDAPVGLADLGLATKTQTIFEQALKFDSGMFLMTGPTGSGKTTTLYALLQMLDDGETKIVTIEDPVEYVLPNAVQIAVDNRKNLTFATGLRSILRHDPDVIMVGEIRDAETAGIAVQAALTGHQVFATLHANSAIDGLARLRHLGVEPMDLVSSVRVLAAQRLARKICTACSNKERTRVACTTCDGSGVSGRIPLAEVLLLNASIRTAIEAGEPLEVIQALAAKEGFSTLSEEALIAHQQGLISASEQERFVHAF